MALRMITTLAVHIIVYSLLKIIYSSLHTQSAFGSVPWQVDDCPLLRNGIQGRVHAWHTHNLILSCLRAHTSLYYGHAVGILECNRRETYPFLYAQVRDHWLARPSFNRNIYEVRHFSSVVGQQRYDSAQSCGYVANRGRVLYLCYVVLLLSQLPRAIKNAIDA